MPTISRQRQWPPEPWLTRGLLVAVVLLFCAPLFFKLGHADLTGDEPIYSYAVDQLLLNGDWMTPRYIPHDTAFLEKPPLKFWLIAAGVRAGVLPDNEFGHRFWDALFGGIAFLYVFGIAHRAAGPVAGFVAVLVLFAQQSLVLDHGLRSNNMEAALVLAYCGGIYHALAWSSATSSRARAWHPQAFAAYFTLGFMTKFVAVVFLPLVIALIVLASPLWRRRAREDWRWWAAACGLAAVLILPWFAYQTVARGAEFWRVILTVHVVERMRVSIDPGHIRPWQFYWVKTFEEMATNGTASLILAGLVLLSWRTFVRRWDFGSLVLVWLIVPLAIISGGRGKLYHYAYPFLPPLAIAAGYGATVLLGPLTNAFSKLEGVAGWLSTRLDFLGLRRSGLTRKAAFTMAVVAFAVAAWTIFHGRFGIRIGDVMVFRNRSAIRPTTVAVVLLALTGATRQAARMVLALLIIGSIAGYAGTLRRLDEAKPQLQALQTCIRQQYQGRGAPQVYGHGDPEQWRFVYYFLPLGWTNPSPPDESRLVRSLTVPDAAEPVLITEDEYAHSRQAHGIAATIPAVQFDDSRLLLLPGRFGVCAAD